MKNRTFEDFDFTDFWDDDEYAKNGYIGEFPTEEMIEEVERELGYIITQFRMFFDYYNTCTDKKNTDNSSLNRD